MAAALFLPSASESAGWTPRLATCARYANWAMAVIAVLGLAGWTLHVGVLASFGAPTLALPSEAAMLLAGAVALAALHGAGLERARHGVWTMAAFIAIVASFGLLRRLGVPVEFGLLSLGDPQAVEGSIGSAGIYLFFSVALALVPLETELAHKATRGLALAVLAAALAALFDLLRHGLGLELWLPNRGLALPVALGLAAGSLSLGLLRPWPALVHGLDALSARRRPAAEVPASSVWLKATLHCLTDAVLTADRSGTVTLSNPAAEELLGVPAGAIVGQPVDELVKLHEDGNGPIACPLTEVLAGRPAMPADVDPVLVLADGRRLAVEVCAVPILAADGSVSGGVLVLREVSKRRAREKVLAEGAALMETFAASTPELIIAKDQAGRITMMNPAALRALGLARDQVIGRSKMELYGESEETRHIYECDQQVLETGQSLTVEEHLTTPHGPRSFLVTKSPLRDEHGRIIGLVGVATDITERRQAHKELEQLLVDEHRLRAEAERANRAKDEFLAIVSHELRSPLNALKGWTHVLCSSGATPDHLLVNRAMQAIKRNVEQQARLIDDLLDTSRIVNGKLTLECQPTDLVDVVRAAIDQSFEAAQAKRIELRFKPEQSVIITEGDPGRLQQAVVNLISNAIKFTAEEGAVDIGLAHKGSGVELTVSDNGIGIEPDFLPHVFDRFSQADSSTTRRHWGLGIGLALVRHLVELHGGSVRAVSGGAGRGSTFTVELPLAQSTAIGPPAVPIEGPFHASAVLNGIRVLLVDDDTDARESLQFALQHAGAEVLAFDSGPALIQLLAAAPPHDGPAVLVLDIAMPGEDGFSVLGRVRAIPGLPFIPAIAVTALTYLDRRHFDRAGFQNCLGKPLDPRRLIKAIAVLARKSVEEDEEAIG